MNRLTPPVLHRAEVDAIVADAGRAYFEGCRARIEPFIETNFSMSGAARLHRRAIGWDLVKTPANVVLALPQIGLKLGAFAARKSGRRRLLRRSVIVSCFWRPRLLLNSAGV